MNWRWAGIAARRLAIGCVVLAIGAAAGAAVQSRPADDGVDANELARVFPGADGVGRFEGTPPAAPVYRNGAVVGYTFSTAATVGSVGYSGRPLDVLAGVDLAGLITGAVLRRHSEPILVIGISDQMLAAYVAGFTGVDLRTGVRQVSEQTGEDGLPDAIAGATVSSAVIRDAIVRAGRAIATSRGILAAGGNVARLDRETYAPADWASLLAEGAILRRRIAQGEVAERFRGTGAPYSTERPAAPFVDLYAALLTPPAIGQNLLGKAAFNALVAGLGLDDHAILIAADGVYSFKGTGHVRSGRFERIQVVQGETTIALTTDGYRNIERLLAEGAPELREAGVFVLAAASGFDPLQPWRLDLIVGRRTAAGNTASTAFSLDYRLPDRYRLAPSDMTVQPGGGGGAPLWQVYWRERWGTIAAITALLVVLTVVLIFQDPLVRRYRLYRRVRHGLLAVTLLWMGWYAGGQLSVVNVLTFVHSLMTEFQWEFFLLDPLIFLLWSYVAVVLLFWGRGVFCGWLCPFGALQELLSEAARRLRLPQMEVPFLFHERLWPIKYVIFLGLLAVSLQSTELAFVGAEVEPFKTAISLRFLREWPFVAYAVGLLAAGLFIERLFCRYLCPLGAALAIPARIRMFEWLKRRPQCGRECGLCAQRCPVQAIHPSGAINPNECIHCLACQNLYHDEWICPPLVSRRKRRERRMELSGGAAQPIEGG
jgi:transcriptional regulator of nitric oxide reductase